MEYVNKIFKESNLEHNDSISNYNGWGAQQNPNTFEVFHNFSLVHDDIMDAAPLRRGNVTVHEKWDLNRGILSGDAMLILAYQYLNPLHPLL